MQHFWIYYAGQMMDGSPLSVIREKSREAAIAAYRQQDPYLASQRLVALTREEWELVSPSTPAGTMPTPTPEWALAELRRAVYERFENPSSVGDPLEVIRRRAALLALSTGAEAGVPVELSEDFVRHWVIADVRAFEQLSAKRADAAASLIRENMALSQAYALTLRTLDARTASLVGAPGVVEAPTPLDHRATPKTSAESASDDASRWQAVDDLEFPEDGEYAAFTAGLYDALESSARARLDALRATPDAPYDASLHENLERLCTNEFDNALQRRSVLISEWAKTGQLQKISSEDLEKFISRWAVNDLLAFRKLSSDEDRASATEALRRNCDASIAYAESVRRDRQIQALLGAQRASTPAPHLEDSSPPSDQNGFVGGNPGSADAVVAPGPFDPQAVARKLLESVTYETQRDGSVRYSVHNQPAFVDHGHQILMVSKAHEDEESILAGLLLAKEKYGGSFELTGTEEFKRRAIEVMVKYQIDATLKQPAQDALHRELLKQAKSDEGNPVRPDEPSRPARQDARIGAPREPHTTPNAAASKPATLDATRKAADLVAIRAIDWWEAQCGVLKAAELQPDELEASLRHLGPAPSCDQIFWFTKSGRPCEAPQDASAYVMSMPQMLPGFSGHSSKQSRPLDSASRRPEQIDSDAVMPSKRRAASRR